MRHKILLAIFCCYSLSSIAQPAAPGDFEPTDYLTREFHAGRRAALRAAMPDSSVMVVAAYPLRNFSADVDYVYHANPDLYYLTGYREPNALLFIFKNPRTDANGKSFTELFFVQKRNPGAEQWTGKRLGIEGVQDKLGIRNAYNGEDFSNYPASLLEGCNKIILSNVPLNAANDPRDPADQADLMEQLKTKMDAAGITADYPDSGKLLNTLRGIKTEEEIALLRKATEISCQGQNEVMKAVRPDMSELEIQGLHEYVHKKYGAEGVGYGSIIGSGENGCTLHYETNTKTRVGNNLILMDVGAEYHGYTADLTRTIPANGKFSPEQKQVYQLVYDAQEAAFALLKDGCTWKEIERAARKVITSGLVKLGIAASEEEANAYYPHGLGHHIGLDVHDRGSYQKIEKNMVITIEPGLYIPGGSKCDPKWWGIAVRIEDDALITQDGYELLTRFAPRKIEEIEKKIAEKSALDDFKLPPLESGLKKGF